MERKPHADPGRDEQGRDDQGAAGAEARARATLLALGADALEPRPWQPASPATPPSAVDLVRYFLWRSARGDLMPEQDAAGALAALALVPAARAEADQLETAALFSARAAGHTWGRMADALGLGSPQAVQQRLDRLVARAGEPGGAP